MKKLKKSIKAIIISICAVVVLAGSIVGAVLANKNKDNGSPAGNGGASVVKNEFVGPQVDLMNSINSNIVEIETVEEVDNELVEQGNFDVARITEIASNYVVVNKGDFLELKFYTKNQQGEYEFSSLSEVAEIETLFSEFQLHIVKNGYLFYSYVYTIENDSYQKFVIAKVDDNSVVVINEYETLYDEEGNYLIDGKYTNINIEFYNSYYYVLLGYTKNSIQTNEISVYEYDGQSEYVKKYEVGNTEIRRFYNNHYYIISDTILNIGMFNTNDQKMIYIDQDTNSTLDYDFIYTNSGLFMTTIQRYTSLANLDDRAVFDEDKEIYFSYNYSYYDFSDNQIIDINLKEGYVKADFVEILSNKYLALYEKKTQNYILEKEGRFVYYDLNSLNSIISYDTTVENDKIYYANNNKILTISGIYTIKNGEIEDTVIAFKDKYSVVSKNIICDNFIVYNSETRLNNVMNLNGEVLFDNFSSVAEYSNGNYIVKDYYDNVYLFNITTLKLTKVEGFELSNLNNSLAFVGFGVYVTGTENNYKLYDYSGTLLQSNIDKYELVSRGNFVILKITLDDTILYYKNDNIQTFGQAEQSTLQSNEEINLVKNEITPYADTPGGNSKTFTKNGINCGKAELEHTSGKGGHTIVTITVHDGFYPKSGTFTFVADDSEDAGFDWTFTRNGSTATFGFTKHDNDEEFPYVINNGTQNSGITWYAGGGAILTVAFRYKANTNWYAVGEFDNAGTNTMDVECLTYTATLDDNGGSGGSGSYTITYSSSVSRTTVNVPTRVGYTFNGYYHGSTQTVSKTGNVLTGYTYSASDWTSYADWTAHTYTISYTLNGGKSGTYAPTSATFGPAGGSYDKTISNPTKLGYTFSGWSISGMSTNCTHWWDGSEQGSAATASNVTATTGFLNLRSESGTVTFTANWTANTYTVKFVNITGSITVTKNTGTDNPSSYTKYNNGTTTLTYAPEGGTYDTSITNPAKTGYTFTGWDITNMSTDCRHCWGGYYRGMNETATGVKDSTGFLNLRSTSGTVTFTATWSANKYSISYALAGGVKVDGKEYPASGTYDTQFKVDEPIRTGYTFTGWTLTGCGTVATHYYGSTSASTSFTTSSLVNQKGPYFKNLRATSGTVTFTAVWTANNYTIEYDMNNPNDVTDDISEWSPDYPVYDETIYLNGTPTKTGYIFSHWNVSGMDENSSVTGDIVTHYQGVSASLLEDFTGTTLNEVTFPRYFKNLHSTSGIVTFTAQWTPITYNLTYDTNGGVFNSDTNNPTSATYDAAFNVTTPVKHGYNFTSWDIEIVGVGGEGYTYYVYYPYTGTESFINRTTINGATVKFTATWAAISYNINFEYNNPTKENDSTAATYATWKNIANPTRMGYLFDYWEIVGTSACGHTANCACFTSADNGTCSHYYNSTNSNTGATRFTGESLASCTSTYYKNLHCISGSTVTFKAHWVKKTYNVINAGSVYGATISTEYPKYDEVFSMTEPTSAPGGYHFNGWKITGANDKDEYTNETVTHIYGTTSSPSTTFTGISKTVGKTVMYFKNLSSNNWTSSSSTNAIVTISPVWEANTYTIAFDMNNPNRLTNDITSMSSITATYDTASNIANPTKSGYTFEGWSLSGLTTDCLHYYGDSSSSMTSFEADPNGAYKNAATTQYILLKNTYYKNLRSEAGTATLKANWKAVTYTITYHYIPESFNVADYNASQLFTHINIPKNMTSTKTVTVTYDTYYEAIDAKNELGEVIFAMPVGLKFKLWTISKKALGDNAQIAKYNSSNVVVTNLSDSIMPGEKRIYGPGKESDGELTWQYYSSNIHLYACYDLAGINLRYYGPSAASGKNDLSKYSNLSAINTNVKYTEYIRFASYASVVDGVNLMGWMISADYFSVGKLTEQSVTIFDYKGGKYIAYQGTQAYWSYTNVDAYSYEDPTYFLYAVYSDDYSGSTHALDFTYRNNSSGSFGAMHSAKFYSVKGTDSSISTLKIPKIYNDGANGWLPVELIDNNGFKDYTNLTSATWFDTMRRLGDYAFYKCTSLATFTLNEGLHTLGTHAFYKCTARTSLSMPSSLRVIGVHAFNECSNVTSVSLNEGLLTIGDYAFYYLSKVTSLTLPSSLVGEIGDYAFSYIEMTSVTIPKGVTTIGYGCFYQCTKLATVTFASGSSLKKIEGSAFNRTVITSISVPNSVTQIDNYAFYKCSKLTTATLPDTLTSLGESVFFECTELTSITIPKGLTSISQQMFYSCAKLASVTIYNGILTIGANAFAGCSSLTTLTIPNSVTTINKSALYSCSKLATLSVPFVGKNRTTTAISEYNFGYIFGASGINEISSYVPASLKTVYVTNDTSIDVNAFNGCSNLTHLYINKGVTTIGQNAFNGCTALVELSIPFVGTSSTDTTNCYLGFFFGQTSRNSTTSSVPTSLKTVHITNSTFVGDYAFYYAPVTTVNLNEGITTIEDFAFANSKITGITLPKSCTQILTYAFSSATELASVNFNDGLTSIGSYAFHGTKIASAVIPQSVTTIGTDAFRNCDSLVTLVLFDGLTSLGNNAFYDCDAITSVKIPKTLTSLPNFCFYSCDLLSSVTLHDALTSIGAGTFYVTPALTSIKLPNSLTTISDYAFEQSGLTSIYIPDSVTTLAREAFDGCSSLVSVRLSNNITTIGWEAFMGTAITRIEIPASVTTIGFHAFNDCAYLVDVVIHGEVTNFNIADGSPFANCPELLYFYYGGNSTTFQGNISGYGEDDLFPDSMYMSIDYVFNFDHMQFTYHNGYYSFKSKGSIAASDDMIIPYTYNDGIHGRYNVRVIEEKAFYNQSSMDYVYFNSSVTAIEDSALSGCSALVTANIPSTVSYIGSYAFYGCVAITSKLTIPSEVVHIYDYTFYNCKKAGLQFASGSSCEYIGSSAFYYGSNEAGESNRYLMTIPNDVEYIGSYAFYYSRYMFTGELKLPSGLLYLGRSAFYNSANITYVSLPDTLDALEEYTFYSCDSLAAVYIPDSIKHIAARSYNTGPFYNAGPNYSTAPTLTLYLEGNGIPSGWGKYWNCVNSSTKKANVFYGYSKLPKAKLSTVNTSKYLTQDSEGTFKIDLTTRLSSSSTPVGLKIEASYYVNVRFEYMMYGDNSNLDMCVEINGSEYPVSLLGNTSASYQYYSRLLKAGDVMKILMNNYNCSSNYSCGLYIKNLRIEPIEKYGDYDLTYSGDILTSSNYHVHSSQSGFTYYATEHCELSLGYRSYGESIHDYVVGSLNGTQKFSSSGNQQSSTYTPFSIILKPGDYFRIYYRKDVNTNSNADYGYFKNFYIAKISEYYYDALNPSTETGLSGTLAYKNATVSESFDVISQWTNITNSTVSGWEQLYRRIEVKKYNATMRFALYCYSGTSILSQTIQNKVIAGPFMMVSTVTPAYNYNPDFNSAVAYGCFLPQRYRTTVLTLTIPTPGSYYLSLNLGGFSDDQYVSMDFYCLESIGVDTDLQGGYADSAFDNWSDHATQTSPSTISRTFVPNNYASYVNDGDLFMKSSNYGIEGRETKSITTYVAPHDGLLTFDYLVSSEIGHDTFHVYLNNSTAPLMIRTGEISGSYAVALHRGDRLKFVYRKDSSDDVGDDRAIIRNIKFKKYSVFNDNGNGKYSSSNSGMQSSECVMVIHSGVSNYYYDGMYSSPPNYGNAYISLSFDRELIHDRVEVYDEWGNLLYNSKSASGSTAYLDPSVHYDYGSSYFIVKYIKDGSINSGSDVVNVSVTWELYNDD